MVESIRRFGQLTPATVSRTGKSRYEMVDGFKRLRACRHPGVESIEAGVLEGHGRVIKTAIVQFNRKGNSIRDIEEALLVQSLHREDQLDQVEIAVLPGRDRSWVCRRGCPGKHAARTHHRRSRRGTGPVAARQPEGDTGVRAKAPSVKPRDKAAGERAGRTAPMRARSIPVASPGDSR